MLYANRLEYDAELLLASAHRLQTSHNCAHWLFICSTFKTKEITLLGFHSSAHRCMNFRVEIPAVAHPLLFVPSDIGCKRKEG